MSPRNGRVLIVGRSSAVLLDTVAMLRERGYAANASNQFDHLLDDFDPRDVDLVVFGGMVPQDRREQLQGEMREANPHVTFLKGLGGIAPLLVAQVEEFFRGTAPGVGYDAVDRVVRVTLDAAARVVVEGIWGTFVPPEPVGHRVTAFEGELGAGAHAVPIPGEVPLEASFAVVRVGERVSAMQIGATPQAVQRIVPGSLPTPEPVSTRLPWA